jgi:hypothetical protein
MCDLITPLDGLTVEVFQCSERASCEKRVAHILDGSLDASFLIASRGSAGPRLEMIMSRHLEQARMKTNRIAQTCVFRGKVSTDSDRRYPVIPTESIH